MLGKIKASALAVALSLPFSLVLADTTAPSVPGGVTVNAVSTSSASLSWSAAYDESGVAGYNVYRDGQYVATVHDTHFTDSGLAGNQTHYYWLVAFDHHGNFSPTSSWAFAHTSGGSGNETRAANPPAPTDVSAWVQSDGSVKVTWQSPDWHRNLKAYNIYRDGFYIATVNGAREFIDWHRSSGSTQSYDIVAVDDWDRFSEHSSQSVVSWNTNTGSSNEITTPTNLRTTSLSHDSMTLAWDASSVPHLIKGYNLYRNGTYLATTDHSSYTDSALNASTEYQYQVVAYDHNNNYSGYSDVFRKTTYPAPNSTSSRALLESPKGVDLTGYYLAFSDEFNQTNLDLSKWNTAYLWGPNLTTNNEEQYYVDIRNQPDFGYQPFSGNGEYLSITASKTPEWLKASANWKNYLSGVMTSYDAFQFTYGYAEARIRPPKGRGMFSAFWLLNARYDGITPEIDIAEFLGESPDVVYHTYHYYDQDWRLVSSPSYETWTDDFTDDFHTFAVKWSPGEIIWYVDGEERQRLSHDNISSQPMYLLFNVAVGGNWPVSPDWTTQFPSSMDIDYVRVYRR